MPVSKRCTRIPYSSRGWRIRSEFTVRALLLLTNKFNCGTESPRKLIYFIVDVSRSRGMESAKGRIIIILPGTPHHLTNSALT